MTVPSHAKPRLDYEFIGRWIFLYRDLDFLDFELGPLTVSSGLNVASFVRR